VAERNSICNGYWIDGGGKRCIQFNSASSPISTPQLAPVENPSMPKPSTPTTPTEAPRGGVGYFNYDSSDLQYGPNGGWGDVRNNAEHLRFKELSGTLNRKLVNKCNRQDINQSPIDICENKINNECREYHQTRTHVRTLVSFLLHFNLLLKI
jgi:hypothetical protein